MRTVVQRVSEASVSVNGQVVGQIDPGPGLLVLAGFEDEDKDTDLDWMVRKLIGLRIFPDDKGVMNLSVDEVKGQILAVSQFTLFASVKKGNRPSWGRAARGDVSQPMFEHFADLLSKALGRPVQTGTFGADMQVSLINDGPVTIVIDSKNPE
ncbi:MAG: D-tyrosyl-tRNA(Tyr) deacylase [Rhodocyclaceae bacterium]|nr:MAG: D-tyrosyl-tRNA(Tyr) deacylase [Rhodocyclaceae bacterium]